MKTFKKSLLHTHTPESIQERLNSKKYDSLIKDIIYGGSDGIVTTFAIVAGVSGAGLDKATILILGFSNVLADGFSMAAGNYLGTKTERDLNNYITDFEINEIRNNPEGEKSEVREIFRKKGFEGKILEDIVEQIVTDRTLWIETMLADEYGISKRVRRPLRSALFTFGAFLLFGVIPLFPFLVALPEAFSWSMWMTGVAFIILGAFRSLWTIESLWKSSLRTLLLGTTAAAIAYVVGKMLKDVA